MKIKIWAISDSDKHFKSAIGEYEKRLSKNITVNNIKPSKASTPKQAIQKDTEELIKKIEKSDEKRVLLSKDAKPLDTLERAKTIVYPGVVLNFIIGGPYGLDENQLEKYINKKISFGKITLPHGLAKLILLEQIYRASTIHTGKKYHY